MMDVSFDTSLNCPAGLHGPLKSVNRKSEIQIDLSTSLLTSSSRKEAISIKTPTHQANSNGLSKFMLLSKSSRRSVSTVSTQSKKHQHKKAKLWDRIGTLFRLRHFHFKKKVSKTTIPAITTDDSSAVSASETPNMGNESLYCCELERRAEAIISHYKELFSSRIDDEIGLLDQRKRLIAALTPCTFVNSSDQWGKMKDVLQEVIAVEAPPATNDADEFVHVGDLFISAHRFMEVKLGSQTQIISDPKSRISLPYPSKWVNWLSPATESEICANDVLRDMIGLSSIWFVYVDSGLFEDSNSANVSGYDSYSKQLLDDLFAKGNFGLIGDQHNLIVPLIFDFSSSTSNISKIPKHFRPFCAVLTEEGLSLGHVVFQLVSQLFTFLLNELFITNSISQINSTNHIMSNTSVSEIAKMQISVFLYYMDLRLFLIKTKFALLLDQVKYKKEGMETKSIMTSTQYLKDIIEFGEKLFMLNSNLLLQGTLQNRYQFKLEDYWISSSIKESTGKYELKTIINSLDGTFGKIQKIISALTKLDYKLSTKELSQAILQLCISFLKIFFQDCDFSLNEEITTIRFDSEQNQYVKKTEKVTLSGLKEILLYNPRETKQLPISFVDFFQLIHYVLENITPRAMLKEWIPVLHCELQLIFNKLIWLKDSQNLKHPDFYFTFPIPLGKEQCELSWRHMFKALNIIAICCERMNLPNTDLLYITACEMLYQIFLPHYNFTTKSANKNLDPKWRLIEFRASRTSTQELLFRSEFKSIDWEPVENVFQLLLMHFWNKPPDILQVQVLTSFLNNMLKKCTANLSDNDAGILRFNGIITPHTAIRELGSNISLVNDARFDSLHFLLPRLLFQPDQLVENFEDLQREAWNENPFRFLIQYQLEEAQESRDLVPPWQYSTATFSMQQVLLHDASLIHSTEGLQALGTTASSKEQPKQVPLGADQHASGGRLVHIVNVRSQLKHSESNNVVLSSSLAALDLQATAALPEEPYNRARLYSQASKIPHTLKSLKHNKSRISSPIFEKDLQAYERSSQTQTETSSTATGPSSHSHVSTAVQLERKLLPATSQYPTSRFVVTEIEEISGPEEDKKTRDYYAKDQVVVPQLGPQNSTRPSDGRLHREPSPALEQNSLDPGKAIDVSAYETIGGSTGTLNVHGSEKEDWKTNEADGTPFSSFRENARTMSHPEHE